jgi:hypothetical protein
VCREYAWTYPLPSSLALAGGTPCLSLRFGFLHFNSLSCVIRKGPACLSAYHCIMCMLVASFARLCVVRVLAQLASLLALFANASLLSCFACYCSWHDGKVWLALPARSAPHLSSACLPAYPPACRSLYDMLAWMTLLRVRWLGEGYTLHFITCIAACLPTVG